MFGWDMYVRGIRGAQLRPDDEVLSTEELEYYGVDFEALHDAAIMDSSEVNDGLEGETMPFVGRAPPPDHLNTITVETDDAHWPEELIQDMYRMQLAIGDRADDAALIELWCRSVAVLNIYLQ